MHTRWSVFLFRSELLLTQAVANAQSPTQTFSILPRITRPASMYCRRALLVANTLTRQKED